MAGSLTRCVVSPAWDPLLQTYHRPAFVGCRGEGPASSRADETSRGDTVGRRRATYDGRGVHSVGRRISGARARARSSHPRADGCSAMAIMAMREEDGRAGRKDRIYLSAAPRMPSPKVISDFQLGARGGAIFVHKWILTYHFLPYILPCGRTTDSQTGKGAGNCALCNARGTLDDSHHIPYR